MNNAKFVPENTCHDCCGLGTTTAGIVTDGRTTIFETFTPFKRLTVAEHLITVLCLKSSVDIRGFYAFVYKKLHHHTLFHARTNNVVCHLDQRSLDWPETCALPISNRTHLTLTTTCSTATLASLFIPVNLKVPFRLERPTYIGIYVNNEITARCIEHWPLCDVNTVLLLHSNIASVVGLCSKILYDVVRSFILIPFHSNVIL